jgi:TldD protein
MSQLISCRGGVVAASGMDMDKETLSRIISKALEKGGDFADVYLENRISRQIVMEESKFKSGLYGISQGAGVRVTRAVEEEAVRARAPCRARAAARAPACR